MTDEYEPEPEREAPGPGPQPPLSVLGKIDELQFRFLHLQACHGALMQCVANLFAFVGVGNLGGVPPGKWYAQVTKKLLDESLLACEQAGDPAVLARWQAQAHAIYEQILKGPWGGGGKGGGGGLDPDDG
jgi:hypothetical protein